MMPMKILIFVLWLGCFGLYTHAQTVSQKTINIVVALPISGDYCVIGQQLIKSVQLSTAAVNANSTLLPNHKIVLHQVDSGSGGLRPFYAVSDLISTIPVSAVIGPFLASQAETIQIAASRNYIPVVSPTDGVNLAIDASSVHNLFRMSFSVDQHMAALLQFIKTNSWTQFGAVTMGDVFGRAAMFAFTEASEADVTLTTTKKLFIPLNATLAEIKTVLEPLKEGTTRLFFLFGTPPPVTALIFQVLYEEKMYGKGWTWVGLGVCSQAVWMTITDHSVRTMVRLAMSGFVCLQEAVTQSASTVLATTYQNVTDCAGGPVIPFSQVTNYVPAAYDALTAIAHACNTVVLAGGDPVLDTPFVMKALASVNFQGVAGQVAFDSLLLPSRPWRFAVLNLQPQLDVYQLVGSLNSTSYSFVSDTYWASNLTVTPYDQKVETATVGAIYLLVVEVTLVLCLVVGKVLEHKKFFYVPESGVVVICGAIVGVFIRFVGTEEYQTIARFDDHLFTLILLPIIIFESGYSLHKGKFFGNLGVILIFSIFGTLISTFVVGMMLFYLGTAGVSLHMSFEEAFAFASLISAVDPVSTLSLFTTLNVDAKLHIMVYGESVINDAVAIVLYRSFSNFIYTPISPASIGSTIGLFIGVFLGSVTLAFVVSLLVSVLLKYVQLRNMYVETMIIFLFSYAAFQLTEALGLSGIVASLFTGICMSHYATKNVDDVSKKFGRDAIKMLASLSETLIFYFVGENIVLYSSTINWGFVGWTILACLLGRACNVFPLACIANLRLSTRKKIPVNHMVMMWHAGLRGAIAYALSIDFPSTSQGDIITCTSFVIIVTIFIFGGTSSSMIRALNIETNATEIQPAEAGMVGEYSIYGKLSGIFKFDRNVLMPLVTQAQPVLDNLPLNPRRPTESMTSANML